MFDVGADRMKAQLHRVGDLLIRKSFSYIRKDLPLHRCQVIVVGRTRSRRDALNQVRYDGGGHGNASLNRLLTGTNHVGGAKRLQQIAIDTESGRLHNADAASVAGEHDDSDIGCDRLNHRNSLDPLDVGEKNIEQDDVGAARAGCRTKRRERGLAIRKPLEAADLIEGAEPQREGIEDLFLVIHQPDRNFFHKPHSSIRLPDEYGETFCEFQYVLNQAPLITILARMKTYADFMVLTCLLPLGVLLWRWKETEPLARKALWYFLQYAASAAAQGTLAHLNIRNWWVISIDFLVACLVALQLFAGWDRDQRVRRMFTALQVLFVTFWIASKFSLEQINGPSPYTAPVSHLLIGLAAARALYSLIENVSIPIHHSAQFWIAGGILFSAASDLVTTAVIPLVIDFESINMDLFFGMHWTRVIFVNIVFVGGITWCRVPALNSGGHS